MIYRDNNKPFNSKAHGDVHIVQKLDGFIKNII